MSIKFYEDHCRKFAEEYPKLALKLQGTSKAFSVFNKLSTVIVYLVFVASFAYLLVNGEYEKAVHFAAVPFIVFFAVTVVRKMINAPRPYEKYPIKPLVQKATKGKSCPSRHSACAMIIGIACLYISLPLGIVMIALATLITASRPVMGVHFPLDVVAGAGMAVILGVPLFWMI